jgi:L-iditol 2-dehydrogenase
MCRNYSYIGSRRNGAFAEYVAVPEDNLIELSGSISFEEAAMLEPMAVAVHAMRRLDIRFCDTVTVCGLGTIGMLLVMFLLDAGIEQILVVGNKDFQRETVLKLGISEDCYCDSRTQDAKSWIMEKTSGNGTDVFFECVGRNETISMAVDVTAPAGRICFVGNPYSDMTFDKTVYWKILRNQLTITGTWNSSFTHSEDDDWHYVLNRLEDKKIQPSNLITHRYSLEDICKGFEIMRDKSEDYIKILHID